MQTSQASRAAQSCRAQNGTHHATPPVEMLRPEEIRAYARVHFALMASLGDGAKAGERATAAALLAHEGRFYDGEAFPSIATVGRLAGLSERAVQGHVDALLDKGRLDLRTRLGRSSVYRVCFPEKPDWRRMRRPRLTPAEAAPPADSAHDQRGSLSPVESENLKQQQGEPAPAREERPKSAAASSLERALQASLNALAARDDSRSGPPAEPSRSPPAPATRRAKPLARPTLPDVAPALLAALLALREGMGALRLIAEAALPSAASRERVVRATLEADQRYRSASGSGLDSAARFVRACALRDEHDRLAIEAEGRAALKHGEAPPQLATQAPAPKPSPKPDFDSPDARRVAQLRWSLKNNPHHPRANAHKAELKELLEANPQLDKHERLTRSA